MISSRPLIGPPSLPSPLLNCGTPPPRQKKKLETLKKNYRRSQKKWGVGVPKYKPIWTYFTAQTATLGVNLLFKDKPYIETHSAH